MRNGLTLMEEAFCQLIVLGKAGADAYSEAFSKTGDDPRRRRAAVKAASHLQTRADILERIDEIRVETRRRNQAKWEQRGEELAERIFVAVMNEDRCGKGMLSVGALKGVEVLARLKGLNAPDTTVLKDGGRADDFVPRGVEAMSADDLRSIVEGAKTGPGARGGVVDVEVCENCADASDGRFSRSDEEGDGE